MAAKCFLFRIFFFIWVAEMCKAYPKNVKGFLPRVSKPQCETPVKRIIGGEIATPNQWPWQAQILRWKKENNSYVHRCGGSLFNLEWVVTAAHCVFDQEVSALKVRLGEYQRNVTDISEQDFTVSAVHLHSRFLADSEYAYDIAILRLNRTVKTSCAVYPICLPRLYDQVPIGKECFLTGWGMNEFGGDKSNFLRLVKLPVVSYQDCYDRNKKKHRVDRFSSICVGTVDGNQTQSGCHGDSGGPLACQDDNGRWELQGVVSWGDHHCGNAYYSVFTRVSSFVDWIGQKMASAPLQKTVKCVDTHYYCKEWKEKGWCDQRYFEHMLKGYYCKKTCGAC
ncbi:elastase-1-like [Actinia tenebrosa]|uniref:Elastase-1-like n=1 Tax=Actinia tenebrosa TaxID=6105 RepID=A0A6P8HGF1_ACTTE|nr:elastase-1-like [Actinia tenebrosa]